MLGLNAVKVQKMSIAGIENFVTLIDRALENINKICIILLSTVFLDPICVEY